MREAFKLLNNKIMVYPPYINNKHTGHITALQSVFMMYLRFCIFKILLQMYVCLLLPKKQ
jgi:hypothetical protein